MFACCFLLLLLFPTQPALAANANSVVRWYAPFLAESGFGSEATSFVESLQQMLWSVQAINFAEPAQFAPPSSIAQSFHRPTAISSCIISICHSTPNFWATPQSDYSSWDRVARCPPLDSTIKIGRSMFETNALPEDWKWRLNYMDYIWVPTKFAKQVYLDAGIDAKKLVVVPESLSTPIYTAAKPYLSSIASRQARARFDVGNNKVQCKL